VCFDCYNAGGDLDQVLFPHRVGAFVDTDDAVHVGYDQALVSVIEDVVSTDTI